MNLPLKLLVNRLADYGFSGVVVDKLAAPAGVPPGLFDLAREVEPSGRITSADGRFLYVDVVALLNLPSFERIPVNGVILSDDELNGAQQPPQSANKNITVVD